MSDLEEFASKTPEDTGIIMPYEEYANIVAKLFKQMEGKDASIHHAIIGMVGELGELSDPIKKVWAYKAKLDLENILEELGDLAFYCFAYLNIEGCADEYSRATNTKMPEAVYGVPLQIAILESMLSDLADVVNKQYEVNRVENLLDLVFALGEIYGLTEHGILNANVHKLQKRYPSGFFQEHDAIARADKLKDGEEAYA